MEKLTINNIVSEVMELAKEKGFGTTSEEVNVLEKIALIHSEISEALEAYRNKNINERHGLAEELADALIRIFHLAGVMDIDIEKEIIKKLEINKDRDWDWKNKNETHVK